MEQGHGDHRCANPSASEPPNGACFPFPAHITVFGLSVSETKVLSLVSQEGPA